MAIASADLRLRVSSRAAPANVFHAIFELEFSLLEGGFFDLLGFGEVMLGGQLAEAFIELVVLGGENVVLLVNAL
jgi:hypothetical protein